MKPILKKGVAARSARRFYLYISPWIIGFTLFTVVPMVMSLVFSFTSVRMANTADLTFIGFENYKNIFTADSDFLRSIGNTFIFAFCKVGASTVLALLLALLLNARVFGRKVFRIMIYLPSVIPVVSVSLLWRLIFTGGQMNMANWFLSIFGLPRVDFFGSDAAAMFTVIFVSVWSGLGPTMLIFLAALQGVSKDLLEAAELDGAGAVRRLWHIILPSISATTFFVVVTGLIGGLQAYAEVKLLTDGGPGVATVTMNLLIVRNAFLTMGRKTLGYASAQGWIVFVIVMAFTVVFNKVSNRKVHYEQ